MRRTWRKLLGLLIFGVVSPNVSLAIDSSVPAIGGDLSRSLLGDGTGVVIGIVDSGVDDSHPTLAGTDSLGNLRLAAEDNFVVEEPSSTGDDVFGHGTWVASAALGSDGTFTGMATDARFVNARVLDATNDFASGAWVENGVGFAIDQGADILNLSLNFFSPSNNGNNGVDLMLDWAAAELGVHSTVCAGNISGGNGSESVRAPGSALNAITVGRTDGNFDQVHGDSSIAFTADGRMKPDLVAPGTSLTLANDDWEGPANDYDFGRNGCSFATPHVAGMMAQQIEAGRERGLNTSPLVVKATMLNSADHGILSKSGAAWAPADWQDIDGVATTERPLDETAGSGQIDGLALSQQYLAGEQDPGTVDGIGWDLNEIGDGQTLEYLLDAPLEIGSTLSTTLTWFRHVTRLDDGDGIIDSGDNFFQSETLDGLELAILRDGVKIAESVSERDNLQHLHLTIDQEATYSIQVHGADLQGIDPTESFAVAWFASSANPFHPADFDLDGDVDGNDFLVWQLGFAKFNGDATLVDGDANGDGFVDGDDFLLWQSGFSSSLGGGGMTTAVPEPATLGLALASLLVGWTFKRRSPSAA